MRYSAHPGTNQVWVDLHGANKDRSNIELHVSRKHMGWTEYFVTVSEDDVARGRHRVHWKSGFGSPVLERGDEILLYAQFADTGGDPECFTSTTTVE